MAAIEGIYAERLDEFAGMAAHHAASAGDHRGALDLHRRAARAAERVYALAEAAEHYTAALAAAAELGSTRATTSSASSLPAAGATTSRSATSRRARRPRAGSGGGRDVRRRARPARQAALDLAGYWRAADFTRRPS